MNYNRRRWHSIGEKYDADRKKAAKGWRKCDKKAPNSWNSCIKLAPKSISGDISCTYENIFFLSEKIFYHDFKTLPISWISLRKTARNSPLVIYNLSVGILFLFEKIFTGREFRQILQDWGEREIGGSAIFMLSLRLNSTRNPISCF